MENCKVGILAIHGMGRRIEGDSYYRKLEKGLKNKRAIVQPVYWQGEMQSNQWDSWERFKKAKMSLLKTRAIFFHSFADASNFAGSELVKQRAYHQIEKALKKLTDKLDDECPIIICCHSLGAHVFNCWYWDNQNIPEMKPLLERIVAIVTTGNNIPFFLNGVKEIEPIRPVSKEWRGFFNFWDKDDILGYPLSPVSKEYNEIVTDIKINAGLPIISHSGYWKHKRFIKLVNDLIDCF